MAGALVAVIVGIEPDALETSEGKQISAWLQAAADRGGLTEILEENEQLWVVRHYRDGAFHAVGAATTQLVGDVAEVCLVGGLDCRDWLQKLDDRIAAWARDEGRQVVRAYGRKGWSKILNWKQIGERGGVVAYEREV